MINGGRTQAKQLSKELDEIDFDVIPAIKDKFKKKNDQIDKCDAVFDQVIGLVESEEAEINKDIGESRGLVKKLTDELAQGNDAKLKELYDEAYEFLNQLESKKQEMAVDKDMAESKIKVLDELEQRVVSMKEITDVHDYLNQMLGRIGGDKNDRVQDRDKLKKMKDVVDEYLTQNKARKNDEA